MKARISRARSRFNEALKKATAWVRFIGEVKAYRFVSFEQRVADLAHARYLIGIAEARAKVLRGLGVRK